MTHPKAPLKPGINVKKALSDGAQSGLEALIHACKTHGFTLLPGFADVHVHLREPGFSYKETIFTGTMAAARGGFTAVCAMPNLRPAPDTPENLKFETERIERDAQIAVYPYGTITEGENGLHLSDMEGLSPGVIAFSDDGHGVEDPALMEKAMKKAKNLGKIIAAHCEEKALAAGGYIHAGKYASQYGHKGISGESEWRQVERDLGLAAKTGCAYHVCHVSTEESVALIRNAKKAGIDVTCETAPHYMILDETALKEEGKYKVNPPLRGEKDRAAVVQGVLDGTIDMVATDHAPHAIYEKNKGLKDSAFGFSGLETAFALLYTHFVKTGVFSLEILMERMAYAPRKRFGLALCPGDVTVFDLNAPYPIDPGEFLSKGKATPFEGQIVFGRCEATFYGGKPVWQSERAKALLGAEDER